MGCSGGVGRGSGGCGRDAAQVGVAEGDGEGVGDVGWFGDGGKIQFVADGFLHLPFCGVAVAGDCLFDLRGGVVHDGDAGLAGGEDDDAAGVAHEDGGRGAFVVGVELFDREDIGLERGDDVGDAVVDFFDAVGELGVGFAADDAGFDELAGCAR